VDFPCFRNRLEFSFFFKYATPLEKTGEAKNGYYFPKFRQSAEGEPLVLEQCGFLAYSLARQFRVLATELDIVIYEFSFNLYVTSG